MRGREELLTPYWTRTPPNLAMAAPANS